MYQVFQSWTKCFTVGLLALIGFVLLGSFLSHVPAWQQVLWCTAYIAAGITSGFLWAQSIHNGGREGFRVATFVIIIFFSIPVNGLYVVLHETAEKRTGMPEVVFAECVMVFFMLAVRGYMLPPPAESTRMARIFHFAPRDKGPSPQSTHPTDDTPIV